jgi:hypothetical protein
MGILPLVELEQFRNALTLGEKLANWDKNIVKGG